MKTSQVLFYSIQMKNVKSFIGCEKPDRHNIRYFDKNSHFVIVADKKLSITFIFLMVPKRKNLMFIEKM